MGMSAVVVEVIVVVVKEEVVEVVVVVVVVVVIVSVVLVTLYDDGDAVSNHQTLFFCIDSLNDDNTMNIVYRQPLHEYHSVAMGVGDQEGDLDA